MGPLLPRRNLCRGVFIVAEAVLFCCHLRHASFISLASSEHRQVSAGLDIIRYAARVAGVLT